MITRKGNTDMNNKRWLLVIIIILSIALIIIISILWQRKNNSMDESKANEIVMEMANRLSKMESYLWVDDGFPVNEPNTLYMIPGCGEYKSYQETDDPNIKTVEQIKKETEKVLTKRAAQERKYGIFLDVEAPYYVEYEGELYKNFDISSFLSIGIYADSEILECSNDRIVAYVYGNRGQVEEPDKSKVTLIKTGGNWFIDGIEVIN